MRRGESASCCGSWSRSGPDRVTPAPLSGVKVLEAATGLSAAFCSAQLALWGAHVAILERLGDAETRDAVPHWLGSGRARSIPFEYVDVNKRRRRVDDGQDARDAVATADVLICDGGLEAFTQRFGLTPHSLSSLFPHLVVVMITPFGLTGPRAGEMADALELQALTGYLHLNGRAGSAPIPAPAHLLDHAIGANALVGALAALVRQHRTGHGDLVDVSGLETVAGLMPYVREQNARRPSGPEGGTPEGARLVRCRDGYISLSPALPAYLTALRETFGDGAVSPGDPKSLDRVATITAAAEWLASRVADLDRREVLDRIQARGVVSGPVQTLAEVLDDPQLSARGVFSAHRLPQVGYVPLIERPAQLHRPPVTDGSRAPATVPSATVAEPPLQGLKVLDLTQAWIGPLAGMILADLGASVTKVESPTRPDVWRLIGQAPQGVDRPPTADVNRSWYFNSVNRSKRGLALDLSQPAGAEIFKELAARADIVLENFTPNVMTRFGLDYATLAAGNPQLVMTSFSGFGATGPGAAFKANGATIEGFAGWSSQHCDEDGAPVQMATYPADPICGLQMAACTLVALVDRLRTGRGAHMEGSMVEAACGYVGDVLLREALIRAGATVGATPDDRGRVVHDPQGGWRVAPARPGAPAVVVRRPLEALADEQLRARGWWLELDAPGLQPSAHNGYFWRFEATPLAPPAPPPRLGQDTQALLQDELGVTPSRLERLRRDGVIGERL